MPGEVARDRLLLAAEMLMAVRCDICGAAQAPLGFRPPGLLRDLPDHLRGQFVWAAFLDCFTIVMRLRV